MISTETIDEMQKELTIHKLFRDYIYNETGFKIITMKGKYYGKTLERFQFFKSGYLAKGEGK